MVIVNNYNDKVESLKAIETPCKVKIQLTNRNKDKTVLNFSLMILILIIRIEDALTEKVQNKV